MPVNESNTIQYTVTTSRVPDGTTLYWKTTGNTTNSDIVGGNTGTITVTNNQAFINVTIANDASTDGSKTLGLSLLTGSLSGPTVTTTASLIVVNDTSLTPSYSFSSVPSSINEGIAGTFNVSSTAGDGTTAYWTINNVTSADADFSAVSGSFTITGGTGSFTVTPAADSTTEGAQTFTVSLRTQSTSGTVQVTSSSVTINDTSLNPVAALWNWGATVLPLANRSSPVQLGADTNWSKISTGKYSSHAIKTDGTLWAWDCVLFTQNVYGSAGLGNSNGVSSSSPTQIGSDTNWSFVGSGSNYSTGAIKTNGTLYMWGFMASGQLGNNQSSGSRLGPEQIGALTNWAKISPGKDCAVAIKTDGTLWLWGRNAYGALGLNLSPTGPTGYKSSPVQLGTDTNWAEVSVNNNTGGMAAIKTNGTLWTWGYNYIGQLGQNDRVHRSSPVQVGTDTNWNKVSNGGSSMVAIKTDGTLWSWGSNSAGELGLNLGGNYTNRSSPVQVGTDTTWSSLSAGHATPNRHAAIKNNGTLWVWGGGNRSYGVLGLNADLYNDKSSPTQVGTGTNWYSVSLGDQNTLAIIRT